MLTRILIKILIPVLILIALFYIGSQTHKLYTDHNTYCNIFIKGKANDYYGVRKSSIRSSSDKELMFVYPKHNLKVKYTGDLEYVIICPIPLKTETQE